MSDGWSCIVESCGGEVDPREPWHEMCAVCLEDHRAAQAYSRMQAAIPLRYRDADHALVATHTAAHVDRASCNERGLYLHGPAGTGKTYAVAAGLLKACRDRRLDSAMWANVPELLEQIRRSFNTVAGPVVVDDLKASRGLVVLDDLGAEKPSDWVRERLYCIVNARYENRLPTIITSNLSIDTLAGQVGARVASRLCELCEVVELQGVDRRKA